MLERVVKAGDETAYSDAVGIVGRACAYAYMYTAQVKCMLGSEVDVIVGVGKCRRVGVYGRYCGCTSS